MTAKKTAKTVSGMGVLNDIRGLLSAAPKPALPAGGQTGVAPDLPPERARFEAQLRRFEELVAKQQAALDRLEAEKNDLDAKLRAHRDRAGEPLPEDGVAGLRRDVADLEARKAELEAALAAIEDLLQFKIKELARRIARVYQEAGDDRAGRDFRRITDQLEAADNFGEFVRALVRD